jgi:general secretion pathway protein E
MQEQTSQNYSLSYQFSRKHGVILEPTMSGITANFREILNLDIISELKRHFNQKITFNILSAIEFDRKLQYQTEKQASDSIQVADGFGDELDLAQLANELDEPDDLLENANDAPIVKLLNALITEAVREDASDIHIEQYENRLRVRFRIDGALKQVLEPSSKIAPLIVSRIKVMAKLDIAEKRLPQDGRISLKIGGKPIDVRVSTIPSGNQFERVVLRLLNKDEGRLSLDYLGMPPKIKIHIEKVINRPHGIFLVTGPTGSGKTTTLYAMLNQLNDQESNIMTVENPVEYYIDGINQTQINSNIGMSFASGLRSILRQDPDVIMVGEIRDQETAQIAVQASLTGHVVFSTLHTNTAIGAVTRLRNMNVEPFLLASSLNGVLAQRLVRKLCPYCKQGRIADDAEKSLLDIHDEHTIYEAEGCSECSGSGYKGRIGVFDFFEIDDTLVTMIHNNASESEMLKYIRLTSNSLFDYGVKLILSGETSLDEVIRVIDVSITTDNGGNNGDNS